MKSSNHLDDGQPISYWQGLATLKRFAVGYGIYRDRLRVAETMKHAWCPSRDRADDVVGATQLERVRGRERCRQAIEHVRSCLVGCVTPRIEFIDGDEPRSIALILHVPVMTTGTHRQI